MFRGALAVKYADVEHTRFRKEVILNTRKFWEKVSSFEKVFGVELRGPSPVCQM